MSPRLAFRVLLCACVALLPAGGAWAQTDRASAVETQMNAILGPPHADALAQPTTYPDQPGQPPAPQPAPGHALPPLPEIQVMPAQRRPDVFAQPSAYADQPGSLQAPPAPVRHEAKLPPSVLAQRVPVFLPPVSAAPAVKTAAAPAMAQPELKPETGNLMQAGLAQAAAPAAGTAAAPTRAAAAQPPSAASSSAIVTSGVATVAPPHPASPQNRQMQNALQQAVAAPLGTAADAPLAKKTLITAQNMKSDPDSNLTIATGKVELAYQGYVLHADKVTYNQKTGVMRAEGHVALLTPSGDVEFADAEEITGDMKQAFVRNIGILFPDNSRMAGRVMQRYDERYSVVDKGDYTACNVCKEDPDEPPLWQMRAQQIVHDNENHELYYHDATLDFAGVPVGWTPYLSGPDPTVKRLQGFLSPEPGYSPNLGSLIRIPYYFDISPSQDAVFDPMYSTTNGLQLAGNYRQRFADGNLNLDGSVTRADLISDTGQDEGQQLRGHLFGDFLYNINNIWRAGTDINITSDKSYLNIYRISGIDQLTSRAFVEGFQGRDYAAVNSYYFENLRVGDQPNQPVVLPSATVTAFGEPGQTFGGRWDFGASSLVTMRDNGGLATDQQGPDTRKLSFNGGWQRQLESNTGLVTTVSGLARLDNYYADNVINPENTSQVYNNVLISRPFAQGNVNLRYPMARAGDGYQQLVEPIVAVTGAPAVHNSPDQPIEDSVDVAFDETNLFAPNRFTGYDLIEGGSRAVYGLRNTITTDAGSHIEFFGGQSYNFSSHDDFPQESGLVNQQSDWVGRLDFTPTDWFDFDYGFRLDEKSLSPQRQDARISFGTPVFRPYIRYISAYQTQTTGLTANDEEAVIGVDSKFAKFWQIHAEHTQNFQPQPGPRTTLASLNYIDDCFVFGVQASHDDTDRLDIASGTSVVFHIFLRNLGGVQSDSFKPTYANELRQMP